MFQPFHQRNCFAAHPELSFYVLNDDQPLTSSPHQPDGVIERMNLIKSKLPGVEEVIVAHPARRCRPAAPAAGGRPAVDGSSSSRPRRQPPADGSHVGHQRPADGARPLDRDGSFVTRRASPARPPRLARTTSAVAALNSAARCRGGGPAGDLVDETAAPRTDVRRPGCAVHRRVPSSAGAHGLDRPLDRRRVTGRHSIGRGGRAFVR